jgi:hypothetical protein
MEKRSVVRRGTPVEAVIDPTFHHVDLFRGAYERLAESTRGRPVIEDRCSPAAAILLRPKSGSMPAALVDHWTAGQARVRWWEA